MKKRCDTCLHYFLTPDEYPCNECVVGFQIPPTKWETKERPGSIADHIRSMSDIELAVFIQQCIECTAGHNGLLEWLRKPYEENKDDR